MQAFPSALTAEHEAYAFLLAGIRDGRFGPGDRLIPEDIAAEIGMSRMPVREAFRRLATEGLVVIRPNRGCLVSGLTLDEIFEVFEIRSVLEGLAVRFAVPRIDAAVLAELERLVHLMESSDLRGAGEWIGQHQRFHEYLCGLSGRQKLLRQITTLHISVEPYLRIYFHHAEKARSATAAHRVLMDALRSGDPVIAEDAMREHILGTAPLLASFLKSKERLASGGRVSLTVDAPARAARRARADADHRGKSPSFNQGKTS